MGARGANPLGIPTDEDWLADHTDNQVGRTTDERADSTSPRGFARHMANSIGISADDEARVSSPS